MSSQLHRSRLVGRLFGAAPPGGGEEVHLLDDELAVLGVDCGDHQRLIAVSVRGDLARKGQPVEPAVVVGTGAHLRSVQQVQQEAPVRRPAVDDDGGVRQRSPEPRQCFGTIAPPGDHLGDHGIELRWERVALGDPCVHPDAGPRG